ncbi:MAG: hypothetical protein MJZ03_03295 [archaeon]|nr:hypothetical protein [archaeon]
MTRFEELKHKAELCRLASSRAKSPLMKSYWKVCANKLEEDALNLPVTKASEIRR